LNSGSDTDGGPEAYSAAGGRLGGRAEGRSGARLIGSGGGGGSRSRSRGRVPKYETQLNSGSESDTVEGGIRSEREEVQGGKRERISIPLNSESEME